MDLSETIAPTSDQLDAVDLLTGPRTFTIEQVSKGNAEQPVNIKLAEFPRPWRPGKSMRRVLVATWGPDGASYVGRRLTLWCDPTVRFGGAEVGGVRITHMSHLDKQKSIPLLITRGKSAPYVVKPLIEERVPHGSIPVKGAQLPEQTTKLATLIRENELKRDEALAYFAGVIGREIQATKELTASEAAQVIAALESAEVVGESDPDGWPEVAEVPR